MTEPDAATVARALAAPATSEITLRLVIVEGPDAGQTFLLSPDAPGRLLLGTSPACELRVSDPTVSRRHLAFEHKGRRVRAVDLHSTNGCFIDGVGVLDAFVVGGELIRCGSTAIRVEAETGGVSKPLPNAMRFGSVVGASDVMRRLYPRAERLAAANIPVIIEGETGTGKENLAESIHAASPLGLRGAPFVVFDCTTVSASLLEAELFGHERGAFTGALAMRPGVFEQASGGTLFIDEIGDLDPALQPKLLRAIERGEIRRVGAQKTMKVDVRVLAATRRDLDQEVQKGRFRDDLFHRLAVGRIELPPLRERQGDVTLLARMFLEQLGGNKQALTADVLARLEDYNWPGNVRELRNAVAGLVALGEVNLQPSRASLPPASSQPAGDTVANLLAERLPFPLARKRALEDFERRYVEHVLSEHGGSVAKAAQASGIALRYFQIVKARGRG